MPTRIDHHDTGPAAYEVWRTMLAKAIATGHEQSFDDKPGFVLRGSGVRQAVQVLWPFATEAIDSITNRLRNSLRDTRNVVCQIQRRGSNNGTEEWWIAEDWTPVFGYQGPAEQPSDLDSTNETPEMSDAVAAVLGNLELMRDSVTQQIKHLEGDNQHLRMKITSIAGALRGLLAILEDDDQSINEIDIVDQLH